MKIPNTTEDFSSSDVYLAASLSALGHLILAIDRSDRSRCRFVFENTTKLQKDIDAFWRKTLALEPQALFNSLRSLKWQLHDQ